MKIAIIGDEPGWHSRRLRAAFRTRGATCRTVRLPECRIDLCAPHGLYLPGFAGSLPDAAMVRGISAGTFEQVTLRLGILHALREAGVVVVNDARAIERSVDKGMTSFLLARAGLPTPTTWVTESEPAARRVLLAETARGRDLVLKPLFGSEGKGLARLAFGDALPALESTAGVAYLQRFVARDGAPFDWRVMVSGGRALAAMRREGRDWITNIAQGARPRPQSLSDDTGRALASLAVRAAAALGMDYAGVDLIADAAGNLLVLEVNSVPAWRGLQAVSDVNIAQALADDLLARLARARERRAG